MNTIDSRLDTGDPPPEPDTSPQGVMVISVALVRDFDIRVRITNREAE